MAKLINSNITQTPDYLSLLSDEDKKYFEGKCYYSFEPIMFALNRNIEKLIENTNGKSTSKS